MQTDIWSNWRPLVAVEPGLMRVERTREGVTEHALVQRILVPHMSDIKRMQDLAPAERTVYLQTLQAETNARLASLMALRGQPNILAALGFQTRPIQADKGLEFYLLTEDAHPLVAYMKAHPMDSDALISLGSHAMMALSVCEQHNIVHQRVCLDAFFVRGGRIKLGGFGIPSARMMFDAEGSICATYAHAAPEYFSRRHHDAASDQYQLALMLYELFNDGCAPFVAPGEAITEEALLRRLLGRTLPPPRNAPRQIADVLLRALSHDPAKRFPDVNTMRAQWLLAAANPTLSTAAVRRPNQVKHDSMLDSVMHKLLGAPRTDRRSARAVNWRLIGGLAAGLMLAVVGTLIFSQSTTSAGSPSSTPTPPAVTTASPPVLTPMPALSFEESYSINMQNVGRLTLRQGVNMTTLTSGTVSQLYTSPECVLYSLQSENAQDVYQITPEEPSQPRIWERNLDQWLLEGDTVYYSIVNQPGLYSRAVTAVDGELWLPEGTNWSLSDGTIYAQTETGLVSKKTGAAPSIEPTKLCEFPVVTYRVSEGNAYALSAEKEGKPGQLYRCTESGAPEIVVEEPISTAFEVRDGNIYYIRWLAEGDKEAQKKNGDFVRTNLEGDDATVLIKGAHAGQLAIMSDGGAYVLVETERPLTDEGEAADADTEQSAQEDPTATPEKTKKPASATPKPESTAKKQQTEKVLMLNYIDPSGRVEQVSEQPAVSFRLVDNSLWCVLEEDHLLALSGASSALYAGTLEGRTIRLNDVAVGVCTSIDGRTRVLALPE